MNKQHFSGILMASDLMCWGFLMWNHFFPSSGWAYLVLPALVFPFIIWFIES